MIRVANLHALEILDSRGRPTIAATMILADGTIATAVSYTHLTLPTICSV